MEKEVGVTDTVGGGLAQLAQSWIQIFETIWRERERVKE